LSYHHHISNGGKKVIIEFPKAASIFKTSSFLSTVTEAGVLKEMFDAHLLEQREVAANTDHKTYGSDRIVLDLSSISV
jgi:hypothetical protein